MSRQALTLSVACLGFVWLYRPVRWVHTQSILNSVYWTARSWLWNYPVTPDYEIWNEGDPNHETFRKERARTVGLWEFLAPFFAQRGYTVYVRQDMEDIFVRIPASRMIDPRKLSYPFAPYFCQNEEELTFDPASPYVWPARDREGRDVIIKAVSGAVITNELKALRLLQSEPLCSDARNHTIPVLEFLEFNQQVFAVMPRWSYTTQGDFVHVAEIIRYAHAFFEVVAFLHTNNITHGDIQFQNMFMDVLTPMSVHQRFAGYHTPQRRYVLIDFEGAQIRDPLKPPTPEFEQAQRRDINRLAKYLAINLRCIDHVIPDIVNLLESMKRPVDFPSATAALARFEEISAPLTTEQLNLPVDALYCDNGNFTYRQGPPVYRDTPTYPP